MRSNTRLSEEEAIVSSEFLRPSCGRDGEQQDPPNCQDCEASEVLSKSHPTTTR
jgi:hypothetical protein